MRFYSPKVKIWIVVALWVTLTGMHVLQDWLTSRMLDQAFYWRESFVFALKWVFYVPVTFLLIYFYDLFPLHHQARWKINFMVLLSISLGMVAVHLALFGLTLKGLWPWAFEQDMNLQAVYHKLFSTFILNVWIVYAAIILVYRGYQLFVGLQKMEIERERLAKELSRSKLDALKMQLQPHFLFNTHHNIIALMQKGDTAKATEMLTKLSDLLRISLKENNADLVPIDHEIDWLKKYLDIISQRFGTRFLYQFEIDSSAKSILVPPMLIQPVLENAIKYGVEPLAKAGHVIIRIGPEDSDFKKLLIQVRDDGIAQEALQKVNFGVGLSNIQERLTTLFGTDGFLEIKSNHPNPGLTVSIHLPWITNKNL